MKGLKEYIVSNNIRHVAITRFLRTIPIDVDNSKNAGPLEVTYLRRFIEECGIQCDIILQNKKPSIEKDDIIYFREIKNFNKYDLIIFQPYTFNLYTGIWEKDTVDYIDRITHEYRGKVSVLYNDPNVHWENPYPTMITRPFLGKNIHDKHNPSGFVRTQSDVEAFDKIDILGLYNGSNFENYWRKSLIKKDTIKPTQIIEIKLSEYIFKERSGDSISLFEDQVSGDRQYDVCYFGSNRKGYRTELLKKLFKKDKTLNKLWIGYDPVFENTKVIKKKVEHFLLEKHVQKSKFSIVIGDEAHIDNIKTFRFFENPEMKTLSLIHSSYDPSMKLILNKTLREFCYFTTIEDIHEILNKLHTVPYHTLIELQDKEIKRHFNLI